MLRQSAAAAAAGGIDGGGGTADNPFGLVVGGDLTLEAGVGDGDDWRAAVVRWDVGSPARWLPLGGVTEAAASSPREGALAGVALSAEADPEVRAAQRRERRQSLLHNCNEAFVAGR